MRSLRKPPGSFHHGDLREAALVVATQVVERSRADVLSVRSIAHTLGVSDAAIYRHFSSRDDLLREVGLRGIDECMQAVIAAMHNVHDPADRLLAAGRAYLRHAVEHEGCYRLFASRGFQEDAWTDDELLTELASRGPHRPATDLGYLLAKNPARVQTFDLTFGKAHVYYPEASEDRCTAALLLDVDPVGLVRRPGGGDAFALSQYTNDRLYVASSFMTTFCMTSPAS